MTDSKTETKVEETQASEAVVMMETNDQSKKKKKGCPFKKIKDFLMALTKNPEKFKTAQQAFLKALPGKKIVV